MRNNTTNKKMNEQKDQQHKSLTVQISSLNGLEELGSRESPDLRQFFQLLGADGGRDSKGRDRKLDGLVKQAHNAGFNNCRSLIQALMRGNARAKKVIGKGLELGLDIDAEVANDQLNAARCYTPKRRGSVKCPPRQLAARPILRPQSLEAAHGLIQQMEERIWQLESYLDGRSNDRRANKDSRQGSKTSSNISDQFLLYHRRSQTMGELPVATTSQKDVNKILMNERMEERLKKSMKDLHLKGSKKLDSNGAVGFKENGITSQSEPGSPTSLSDASTNRRLSFRHREAVERAHFQNNDIFSTSDDTDGSPRSPIAQNMFQSQNDKIVMAGRASRKNTENSNSTDDTQSLTPRSQLDYHPELDRIGFPPHTSPDRSLSSSSRRRKHTGKIDMETSIPENKDVTSKLNKGSNLVSSRSISFEDSAEKNKIGSKSTRGSKVSSRSISFELEDGEEKDKNKDALNTESAALRRVAYRREKSTGSISTPVSKPTFKRSLSSTQRSREASASSQGRLDLGDLPLLWVFHDNPQLSKQLQTLLLSGKRSQVSALLEARLPEGRVKLVLGEVGFAGDIEQAPHAKVKLCPRGGQCLELLSIRSWELTMAKKGDGRNDGFQTRARGELMDVELSTEKAVQWVRPSSRRSSTSPMTTPTQSPGAPATISAEGFFKGMQARIDVMLDPTRDGDWFPYWEAQRRLAPQFRSSGIGYLRLADDTGEHGTSFLSVDGGRSFLSNHGFLHQRNLAEHYALSPSPRKKHGVFDNDDVKMKIQRLTDRKVPSQERVLLVMELEEIMKLVVGEEQKTECEDVLKGLQVCLSELSPNAHMVRAACKCIGTVTGILGATTREVEAWPGLLDTLVKLLKSSNKVIAKETSALMTLLHGSCFVLKDWLDLFGLQLGFETPDSSTGSAAGSAGRKKAVSPSVGQTLDWCNSCLVEEFVQGLFDTESLKKICQIYLSLSDHRHVKVRKPAIEGLKLIVLEYCKMVPALDCEEGKGEKDGPACPGLEVISSIQQTNAKVYKQVEVFVQQELPASCKP